MEHKQMKIYKSVWQDLYLLKKKTGYTFAALMVIAIDLLKKKFK